MYRKLLFTTIIFLSVGAMLLLLNTALLNMPARAQTGVKWEFLNGPYTTGGTARYVQIAPAQPNRVYSIVVDRLGTRSRLYRSDDTGLTWTTPYTFSFFPTALAVHPGDADTLYAGADDICLRSLDGGLTWTQIYTLGKYIAINPLTPTTIYAGGPLPDPWHDPYPDVYMVGRSDDGGLTWTTVPVDMGYFNVLAVHPVTPSLLYLGGANAEYSPLVYRSDDGGSTWAIFWPPDSHHYRGAVRDILLHPNAPETIYINASDSDRSIQRSIDSGLSWAQLDSLYAGRREAYELALDPLQATTLYAVFSFSPYQEPLVIHKSFDGGDTWWKSSALLPEATYDLAIHPTNTSMLLAALNEYGIYRSSSGGSAWIDSNDGISTLMPVKNLAYDPAQTTMWAIAGYKRTELYRSTDLGASWNKALDGAFLYDLAVDSSDAMLYVAANDKLYTSRDGGVHWEAEAYTEQSCFIAVATDPHTPKRAFAVGYDINPRIGYLWTRQVNEYGYAWWHKQTLPLLIEPNAIAVDPAQPETLLVGGVSNNHESIILHSADNGSSWTPVLTLTPGYGFTTILFDPHHLGVVYAAESHFHGLYKSMDDGLTWQEANGNLDRSADAMRTYDLIADGLGHLYRATAAGLYRSSDGGKEWMQTDTTALPGMANTLAAYQTGTQHWLLVGSNQGGVYQTLIANMNSRVYLPLVHK